MKYLRSYLLVPAGAGGRVPGSRSSGYRQLRCLTTTHRHNKVQISDSSNYWQRKRHVSTDGAKKSQLAVVGQVAPALPPPSGAEIDRYISVQRRSGAKCPGHEIKSFPADRSCPRHANSYFPVNTESLSEPFSCGQFLSESNSLKSSQDPVSLEMVFMPTFHAYRNDIEGLFFPKRPKSAGVAYSSKVDGPHISPDVTETTSIVVDVKSSKSIEALLPTTETPDDVSGIPTRNVKREIVLPRPSDPKFLMVSQTNFDTFLEVHNFQKRDSDDAGGEKNEDISPFPKCEDPLNAPSGSLIIQNDRSSIIIHRDLYITNRILEKLKKMEDKPLISPEPTVKADEHLVACRNARVVPESHSVALAGIPNSAADAEQSVALVNSISPSNHHLHTSSCPGNPAEPLTRKSDSYLTNIEFGMPSDRMSKLESMAVQSRKNLYARMKNASSPCVLVDGVHVKRTELEDSASGLEKGLSDLAGTAKSETNVDSNPFSLFNSETNSISDDAKKSSSSVDCSKVILSSTNSTSQGTSEVGNNSSKNSSQHENIPHLVPHIDFLPHSSTDSQFQGIPQSEITAHNLGQQSLGEFESEKLQSELEDWFIPLGNEIESMLITLEASKNPLEHPERISSDLEAPSLIFEEVLNVFEAHETSVMEGRGSHPFEGVEIIENALLSPRGHRPFESGQSRNNNTSSGSLPPKSKNPNVDIKTETTIKCCRSGDNTDINVTETQRYLDKRLPYPFCTETVLQVYGTSESLSKATQAVENSKAQLVHLSNADSPNAGMLTPKLQFNHMLSKSHENVKPNSKKTVLKIKVVPNAEFSSPIIQSSELKPQPSHVLQITEQPELSTDVSKLIRRSKFKDKTGPKKVRRGESVMKLRPKKKFNKESSENIKVLSPKDLEIMFPSPPKIKPVEKPRKVTIETKMGKESLDVVKDAKQHSIKGGLLAGRFKSRKVQDDIIIKPTVPGSADTKVVKEPEVEVQVAQSTKSKEVLKEKSYAGLSARDQKILKSMISHKVKDSFIAVTKKDGLNQEVSNDALKQLTQVSPKHEAPIRPEIVTNTPKSPISKTVDGFSSPEVKYGENKLNKAYQNDPKTVYASILGTAKEKVSSKVSKPKSPKSDSPTPIPNREYVTIKTEPTPKTAASEAALAKASVDKKVDNKFDESVLPASASRIIANVMKNSGDMSQSEGRWRHLDNKTTPDQNPDEKFKIPIKSTNMRPLSGRSGVLQKTQLNEKKPEDNRTSSNKLKIEKKEIEGIRTMDDKVYEAFKGKKVWNHPTEPLFFPFETPNYKEILQERPRESQPIQSIPHDAIPKSSVDPVVHEVDFCKLCTENVPRLVQSAPARYRVPLERMKNFPLVNPGKAKSYIVPSTGAMSISPLHDLMLRRNLTQVPAVTKILGATLSATSQQALDRWKQGLISTLGEEGFQEFYQSKSASLVPEKLQFLEKWRNYL